jgi:hypothetical protein
MLTEFLCQNISENSHRKTEKEFEDNLKTNIRAISSED